MIFITDSWTISQTQSYDLRALSKYSKILLYGHLGIKIK